MILSQARFQDIYGLDNEVRSFSLTILSIYLVVIKLLDMVPRDVKAIIFLFPDNKHFTEDRRAEDLRLSKTKQEKLDPTIFWMKQTVSLLQFIISSFRSHPFPQIGNACGTMALIHAIANVRLMTAVSRLSLETHELDM